MTTKRRCALGALATAIVALAAPAGAQDVQNFKPAVGTWNYLSVEGADVAPHMTLVPSLYVNYGRNPLVARDEDGDIIDPIIENLTTIDAMAAFGLYHRFELGVAVPVHISSGAGVEAIDQDGAGLGDIRLVPKVRIIGSRDETGFGAAVSMPVSLPTSSENKGFGAGTLTFNPTVILEGRLRDVFSVAGNIGMRLRPSNQSIAAPDTPGAQGEALEVGNEITYGAGVAVNLGSPDYVALAEVFGATPAESVEGSENANPLEGELGIRIFTDLGLVFTAGVGRGLIADYGSPDFRIIGGVAYERRVRDRDGDGIFDDVDRCPDEPEDKDGYEDQDGCPEGDPPPEAPGDRDGDGLHDDVDKCPDDPEDFDGFEDLDGCPDPDNDQDGVLDAADRCPMDPEDKDGFEDEDGCPDPDNDKDGIPDVEDQCPNEPETINGFQDDDGCPDQGVSAVKVTREKIEILEKVFFDTDKATIKPESFNVLNQVASVLKANPGIRKLRIEGHTDRWGDAESNRRLSQARAESVKEYLVARGIDAGRLQSEGYGPDRPLDPAKTQAADAKNRRVEFVIVEQDDEAPAAPPPPAAPAE